MTAAHRRKVTATTIADVMTRSPRTIASDQKLSAAHRIMVAEGLRHLPVMRAGKLIGVLSQRDLFLVESMAGVDPDIDVIADAMTADVYAAPPDAPLAEVVRTMADHKYGCAVIVESGVVVGVFTMVDALRQLAEVLA